MHIASDQSHISRSNIVYIHIKCIQNGWKPANLSFLNINNNTHGKTTQMQGLSTDSVPGVNKAQVPFFQEKTANHNT